MKAGFTVYKEKLKISTPSHLSLIFAFALNLHRAKQRLYKPFKAGSQFTRYPDLFNFVSPHINLYQQITVVKITFMWLTNVKTLCWLMSFLLATDYTLTETVMENTHKKSLKSLSNCVFVAERTLFS